MRTLQGTSNIRGIWLRGVYTADLAIILIDEHIGLVEQMWRYRFIAALLGILRLILDINKMDLIVYNQRAYEVIVGQYKSLAQSVGLKEFTPIPISAKAGDYVFERSPSIPWYEGPSFL
ncbi:MAG: GTP-binding protein [Flavobacteriales bacterium]